MNVDDIVNQQSETNDEKAEIPSNQDEINNFNLNNLQFLEEAANNYLNDFQDNHHNENEPSHPNPLSDLPTLHTDYQPNEYDPITSHDNINQLPEIRDLSEDEQKEQEGYYNIIQSQNDYYTKALSDKNSEIEVLQNENNALQISLIKNEEQLSNNKNIIDKLNKTISQLKTENSTLSSENKEYLLKNNELNYKLIELNQKLLSKSSLDAINEKLHSYSFTSRPSSSKFNNEINTSLNNDNNNEITILQHKISEIEIENAKLKFENNALKTNIENIKNDYINEKSIENKLHSNEIESLSKYIKSLQQKLSDLYKIKYKDNQIASSSQNESSNNFDNINMQTYSHILEEVKLMGNKIRKLEKEKSNKEIQLKKETELKKELEITLKRKEQIYIELKANYDDLTEYYEQMANDFETKNKSLITEKEYNETQLINKNKEYNDLENKYQSMVNHMQTIIQFANGQLSKVQNNYNDKWKKAYAKLKEYKAKIQTLKMKINELHNEIHELRYGQELNKQLNEVQSEFINSHYNHVYMENEQYKQNENEIDEKGKDEYGRISKNMNIKSEEEQFKQLQDFKDILSKIDENLNKKGNDTNDNDKNE